MRLLCVLPVTLALCLAPASAQVVGTFTLFGTGCASATQTPPTMTAAQGPHIGTVFSVMIGNVPANSTVLVIIGSSNTQWGPISLPLSMSFLGGPNCTLYASGECLEICPTNNVNSLPLRVYVPNHRNLINLTLYMQVMSRDPGSNPAGFAMSRAAKLVIGG